MSGEQDPPPSRYPRLADGTAVAAEEARGDPRRSIEERYPSEAGYLEHIRQEVQRMVDEGYLLAEDRELLVGQASRRYDRLVAAREPITAGE